MSRPSMKSYVEQALASFVGDNPDTRFQRGYLAAFIELAEVHYPNSPSLADAKRVMEETRGRMDDEADEEAILARRERMH